MTFPLNVEDFVKDTDKAFLWQYELWMSDSPHRFSWCILNSTAVMISASHPLTPSCVLFLFPYSSSESKSPSGTKQENTGFTCDSTQQPCWYNRQRRPGSMTNTCRNVHDDTDLMLSCSGSARPASGPLSCYGGWSSTQHPHEALWPPLSSWTSSENNFPPPTKTIKHKQKPAQ